MATLDEEGGERRFHGAWNGIVLNNQDPEGRHRIKIEVPGLIPSTSWARPLTMGGGGPQRGGHVVPAVGADVCVWFLGGDRESPVYTGLDWGLPTAGSETPHERATDGTLTPMSDGSEPEKVSKIQLGRLLITMDERDRDEVAGTGQLFSVEDTTSGDALLYDFQTHSWQLKGSLGIRLKADGLIDLEAAQVQINGRRVGDYPRPI